MVGHTCTINVNGAAFVCIASLVFSGLYLVYLVPHPTKATIGGSLAVTFLSVARGHSRE